MADRTAFYDLPGISHQSRSFFDVFTVACFRVRLELKFW
jgi:hypothetical protein